MSEIRAKKSVRNTIFALLKYVISLLTTFTLRTLVIKYFGEHLLGLNSLYSNIISILSITELGIGTALIYKLYKPVAENDMPQVKAYLMFYKKVYLIIASVIFVIGLAILPFLPLLTNNEQLINVNMFSIYLIFLINSVITYFIAHRRALLFTSQNNFIENLSSSISLIIIFPIQLLAVKFINNFYLYCSCMLFITILDILIIYFSTNKKYKTIMSADKYVISSLDKKEIKKNTLAMSITKVSTVVSKGIDSVIVSSILGLIMVSLYSNYYIIITYLFAIMNLLYTAVRASIGNYISVNSKEDMLKLFNKLNLGFSWLICFCTTSLLVIYQPFMRLWSSLTHANLMLPMMVPILFSIYFYIDANREIVRVFKEGAGHFWEDRYITLISVVLNIVLSFVLGKYCGLGIEGIILATIISCILPILVEAHILYTKVFNMTPIKYWCDYLLKTIIAMLCCVVTYFISIKVPFSGISLVSFDCVLCLLVPNIIYFICFFKTDRFKGLLSYGKSLVKK